MAVVFLAQDLNLERLVAIKVLPPELSHDPKLIPRFQQEAKTAAKLDHPNIIPIYRVESEAGLDYFVMKYVTGRSLEQLIEEGPVSIDQARRVLREAALALGHAHRRRVVHRDVKPANIMLEDDGRVVLTDFGISKAVQGASQLTGTGTIIGTPHYMAPEQAKGLEVDGRADQYSLAVVGHQILTGKQPFDGSAHSILYKHVFEPPPPVLELRPDVPRDLVSALERALSKEPEKRFDTMEDFARAVGGERRSPITLVTVPVKPTATPTAPSAPIPQPRALVRRGFIVAGLCALFGAGGWAGLQRGLSQPEPVALPPIVRPAVQPIVRTVPESALTASPDTTVRKPVKRAPVKLTVDSEPWGMVYLDDREIGPTPVIDFLVMPGRHRLRLEQEGYLTKAENIVVTGDAPVKRRYNLDPAGP
jgi:serine/threonine protein kinase